MLSRDLLRSTGKPADVVVDVGCGSGRWVEVVVRQGANVIGINASAAAVERLTNAWPSQTFICANAEDADLEALGPGGSIW